jgi:hypothetical protein
MNVVVTKYSILGFVVNRGNMAMKLIPAILPYCFFAKPA